MTETDFKTVVHCNRTVFYCGAHNIFFAKKPQNHNFCKFLTKNISEKALKDKIIRIEGSDVFIESPQLSHKYELNKAEYEKLHKRLF